MKHYLKLFLWGLIPIPYGYLNNMLISRGMAIYPLPELAFLIGWACLAWWLCDVSKPIVPQTAALCAAGIPALLLGWLFCEELLAGLMQALSVIAQFYFCPVMLLFARNVGSFFYSLMGESYTIFPTFAATWLVFLALSFLAMGWKRWRTHSDTDLP